MRMAERLFFALWPGEDQRRALAAVQRKLDLPRGRLAHPEDIHLTLVFLGPASADQRQCAEAAAGRVKRAPFELNLDRLGSFPRARVIWCGTEAVAPSLAALVEDLRLELGGCGFQLDQRPFKAHATLVRKAPPLPSRPLEPPIPWPVAEFVLAFGQEGPPPRYRILRRWPLG